MISPLRPAGAMANLMMHQVSAAPAQPPAGPTEAVNLTPAAQAALANPIDTYWQTMRETRKKGEYVSEHPPLPPAPPPGQPAPARPPTGIPTKATFLQAASDVYGFQPETAEESRFKGNYAKEALRAGISREQVVGVYAFETGGDGKYDLQPIRKDGQAISTALGYAQLLNANSVTMMATQGDRFASELEAAGLGDKADVVRRMSADAKTVPADWNAYQAYAKTPAGRAMHAANLDVDIGPKMQVRKLEGVLAAARKGGHEQMTPAQLELLNLAGERNGLKMLDPQLKDLPTANFFDRAGYDANPVVRQRSGAELLGRIDELMGINLQKPGAQEFWQAFG